jgi:histidinol-phosphate aminotransferase
MTEETAGPRLAAIVAALPATVPFVPPEAIERRTGVPLRVRLGANESLFGPSASVVAAMHAAAREIQLYGDCECWDLRRALGIHHGIDAEGIVIGSGIDELLGLFVRAYLEPGEAAVMSLGGYPTMVYQLDGHGIRIERVPYRDFRNDGEALVEAARRSGARLVYLANPDNPTGSHLDADAQRRMLEALPRDCLFLLDEAYAELAPAAALLPMAVEDPRLVRFRTFSKVHGLAGMRVGYAFGLPGTIRPIDRIRNQFGVGRMAQAAALAALADQDHVASVCAAVAEGREDYARLAAELGLVALPSVTNFVAIDTGSAERTRTILSRLQAEHGVFVRRGGTPPLDRCLRVTVGRPEDRARFAAALRAVVG